MRQDQDEKFMINLVPERKPEIFFRIKEGKIFNCRNRL